MELEYFEYLIDFTVATKESPLLDELGKNTANCPYVNSQTVLFLPQQNFRSAVPQGLNLMRQCFDGDAKGPSKSKICNFKYS